MRTLASVTKARACSWRAEGRNPLSMHAVRRPLRRRSCDARRGLGRTWMRRRAGVGVGLVGEAL
eukprot:4211718-Pleurochrysis_carterae.AAC.1